MFNIRWCIRRDVPEILAAEASVDGWGEEEVVASLRPRTAIGKVVESDGLVVGWMLYHLTVGHMELARLAVRPEFRRRGAASALLADLKKRMSPYGRRRCVRAFVPERLVDLQLTLRSNGYVATEVIHHQGEDDTYVMELPAGQPAELVLEEV